MCRYVNKLPVVSWYVVNVLSAPFFSLCEYTA